MSLDPESAAAASLEDALSELADHLLAVHDYDVERAAVAFREEMENLKDYAQAFMADAASVHAEVMVAASGNPPTQRHAELAAWRPDA